MPKILKIEFNKEQETASVKIKFNSTITLWFDVWFDDDGEITGDWNKYIFYTNNDQDMKERVFQDASNDESGAYNFATALEIADMALESKMRLEHLRNELINERISTSELIELQDLAEYIDPNDTQLLEAAGVPEFKE